ncbi:DUF4190 domain-containing protein [Streptomyces coeruleoprunus]
MPPPPGAVHPSANTNGLAIASLVTGLVCLVPPLGLILGAFALGRIKKKGERGKGLAVAGMILSLISTLLVATGIATGAFSKALDGVREVKEEVASSSSAFALRKGDCFNTPNGVQNEEEVERVKSVKCAQPHDAEVTGSFKLTGDTWPGVPEIEKIAEERCFAMGEAYAMDAWAVPDNAWTFYYHPTKESWSTIKDRTVTCAFVAEKGKLTTGSLRSDETTLDADQLVFLKALNPTESVFGEEPEEDPDTNLDANVKWAGKVEKTLRDAGAALEAHTFSGPSQKAVADLVRDLDEARKHWTKAAKATDADTFWEHYEPGYDALPADFGKEARAALKLDTTPPGGTESGSGS